jgi:hypothetical protein
LAYSLLLSFFAVGLGLALPGTPARWWLASGVLPFLWIGVFWVYLRSAPEAFLRAFPWLSRCLLAVLWAWLATGLLVSVWGWARFARWRRAFDRAEAGANSELSVR